MNRRGTGTMLGKRGYILVLAKDHPRANRDGYVPAHILVVEKTLGHFLQARAVVHHVDGNVSNNAPTNLVVCEDQAYHLLLHQRLRAFRACGDPSALKCDRCGRYDTPPSIAVYPANRANRKPSFQARHKTCNAAYVREFNARRRMSA